MRNRNKPQNAWYPGRGLNPEPLQYESEGRE